jgi:protein-disulfide isomerase
MIEYSEFMCPFCGRFARETLPELETRYVQSGILRIAFRDFPIEASHPLALEASVTARCAARQSRFWQAHDLFFSSASPLDTEGLRSAANRLSLDETAFGLCKSADGDKDIRKEVASARILGIRATPTFLLGREQADGRIKVVHKILGAVQFADFAAVIEAVARSR